MIGLALGIAYFGYWTMYYGITQVQGGNWGFLDLGIPSRWTEAAAATPRDGGFTSQSLVSNVSPVSTEPPSALVPGPGSLGTGTGSNVVSVPTIPQTQIITNSL